MRTTLDRLLAALMLFTRLPWWRLHRVPTEAFTHAVDFWPVAGWLTGGIMASVYLAAAMAGASPLLAAALAVAARVMLTGALHEDGLADCADGFGGGTTRERTLAIMKDSHIGTYGVIALILELGLLTLAIAELPSIAYRLPAVTPPLNSRPSALHFQLTAATVMLFDTCAKTAASWVTSQLPYARATETAKVGVVYRSRQGIMLHALRCLVALAPPAACCCWAATIDHEAPCATSIAAVPAGLLSVLPAAFIAEWLLARYLRRRIGGYTGDCCGAIFLLCELTLYATALLLLPSLWQFLSARP